jgi:hypothetical protein
MHEPNEDEEAKQPPSGEESLEKFARDLERAANGGAEERNRFWEEHYPYFKQCAGEWFANRWNRNGVSIGATHITGALFMRMSNRAAAMDKGRSFFFKCFYNECLRIVVDHWRASKRRRNKQQELPTEAMGLEDHGAPIDPVEIVGLLEQLKQLDESVGLVATLKVLESCSDGRGAQRTLTSQEVADRLGMGLRTVEKHWAFGKAWLKSRIGSGHGQDRD